MKAQNSHLKLVTSMAAKDLKAQKVDGKARLAAAQKRLDELAGNRRTKELDEIAQNTHTLENQKQLFAHLNHDDDKSEK